MERDPTVSEALETLRQALQAEMNQDSMEYAACLMRANEIGMVKKQYDQELALQQSLPVFGAPVC